MESLKWKENRTISMESDEFVTQELFLVLIGLIAITLGCLTVVYLTKYLKTRIHLDMIAARLIESQNRLGNANGAQPAPQPTGAPNESAGSQSSNEWDTTKSESEDEMDDFYNSSVDEQDGSTSSQSNDDSEMASVLSIDSAESQQYYDFSELSCHDTSSEQDRKSSLNEKKPEKPDIRTAGAAPKVKLIKYQPTADHGLKFLPELKTDSPPALRKKGKAKKATKKATRKVPNSELLKKSAKMQKMLQKFEHQTKSQTKTFDPVVGSQRRNTNDPQNIRQYQVGQSSIIKYPSTRYVS